jgi:hypothetical protein
MVFQLKRPGEGDSVVLAFRRQRRPFSSGLFPLHGLDTSAAYRDSLSPRMNRRRGGPGVPIDCRNDAGYLAGEREKRRCSADYSFPYPDVPPLVVDDVSWPTPVHLILSPILEELHAAGMGDAAIEFLLALGSHRFMTRSEIEAKPSPAVAVRYPVHNHDWKDPAACEFIGTTAQGVEVWINRRVTRGPRGRRGLHHAYRGERLHQRGEDPRAGRLREAYQRRYAPGAHGRSRRAGCRQARQPRARLPGRGTHPHRYRPFQCLCRARLRMCTWALKPTRTA